MFRRLYLNQWTEQESRWLSLPAWDACQTPVDRAALQGRRCYVGMDLASTTDLTALVAVFPDEGGGFTVLPQFFVPQANIRARATRDRVPYDEWARRGHLVATTAFPTVDYGVVRATLQAWATEFTVAMVGDLERDRLVSNSSRTGSSASRCGRRSRLSAPTKSLEKVILARQLRRDGHPVLRWCISNVAVESDRPEPETLESEIERTHRRRRRVDVAVDVMERNARTSAEL